MNNNDHQSAVHPASEPNNAPAALNASGLLMALAEVLARRIRAQRGITTANAPLEENHP